jgi:hypothetical protein
VISPPKSETEFASAVALAADPSFEPPAEALDASDPTETTEPSSG